MEPFEWRHVEAFPTVLRLLYAGGLRDELRANLHRPDALASIAMHRVIDNASIEMSGEDFWIALNYQLIHLVDFLPAANWAAHASDTSFIVFRDLYDLLQKAGKLEAAIAYEPASGDKTLVREDTGIVAWLATRIPVAISERMAKKSVSRFSEQIGHSLEYTITWG